MHNDRSVLVHVDTPGARRHYTQDMLNRICSNLGPRPVGSANYLNSAEIVRQEFARSCPVSDFDYHRFERWVLKGVPFLKIGGTVLETYPAHGTAPTGPDGILGRLKRVDGRKVQYAIVDASGRKELGYIAARYDLAVPLPYYSFDMQIGEAPVFNVGKVDIPVLSRAVNSGEPVRAYFSADFIPDVSSASVVAQLPGSIDEEIIVIGHLDTVYNTVGANDNTATVIVMMMLAHVLARKKLQRTITFLAADGEEYGKLGAIHYAERRKREGTFGKIRYLVNFDSLTWGPDLQISSRDADLREMIADIDMNLGTAGNPALKDEDGFALDGKPFRSDHIRAMYVNSLGYDTVSVWHRPEDTPDSVPLDTVETGFLVFHEYLNRLASR